MVAWSRLLLSGRSSPPLTSISSTLHRAPDFGDPIHDDPRRYTFQANPKTGGGSDSRVAQGDDTRHGLMSSISTGLTKAGKQKAATQVRYTLPTLEKHRDPLEELRDEVLDLLLRSYPGHEQDESLVQLANILCRTSEIEQLKDKLELKLRGNPSFLPLDHTKWETLCNGIVARVLNFHINLPQHAQPTAQSGIGSVRIKDEPLSQSQSPLTRKSASPYPTTPRDPSKNMIISADSGTFKSSKSQGTFRWYTATSNRKIPRPPPVEGTLAPGDLFFHNDTTTPNAKQVWYYNKNQQWEDISQYWANNEPVVHPNISERVLTKNSNDVPNWILKTSLRRSRTPHV